MMHISKDVEVKWDETIVVGCAVEANRPGITIIDKKQNIAKFVEISVPLDINIVTKTSEKISKYRDLEIAYKK
eukprot:10458651-Ditylum_brightwellii.AAC.1